MPRRLPAAIAAALALTAAAFAAPAAAQAAPGTPTYPGDTIKIHVGAAHQTAMVNVTVTAPAGAGHAIAYACDGARPQISTVNFAAGATASNFAFVRTNRDGDVCIYTTAAAHILADSVGTTDAISSVPARILDTRLAGAKPAAGSTTRIRVGHPNTAVEGNLTVTAPVGGGNAVVYTCGTPRPATSTLNFTDATTIANAVVARTNAAGELCAYTTNAAHLLFDVQAMGNEPAAATPARLLDTRTSGTKPATGTVTEVQTGRPNTTVFANLTSTQADGNAFAVAYPCASGRPATSSLNFVAGVTRANLTVTRTGADGRICIYNAAPTHLILDLEASSSALAASAPARLLDTRQSTPTNSGVFIAGSGNNPFNIGAGAYWQIDSEAPIPGINTATSFSFQVDAGQPVTATLTAIGDTLHEGSYRIAPTGGTAKLNLATNLGSTDDFPGCGAQQTGWLNIHYLLRDPQGRIVRLYATYDITCGGYANGSHAGYVSFNSPGSAVPAHEAALTATRTYANRIAAITQKTSAERQSPMTATATQNPAGGAAGVAALHLVTGGSTPVGADVEKALTSALANRAITAVNPSNLAIVDSESNLCVITLSPQAGGTNAVACY